MGAGPAQNYEGLAKAFEQQFPEIKVSITGGFSNELNAKVEAQAKAKKFETDMAVFQTVQDFVKWKRDGILAHFKPEGFDVIDPKFKDEDGAFVALYVSTISYAYNTKELAAADVPKSALDFLHPRFKGKLITVYPHDDDAALYLFDTIVRKYGWDYMTRYLAQAPKFIQGHLGVARDVASGGSLATFDATVSTAGGQKRAGQPIELAFSDADPTPVFFVTAGLFKDGPHPNAAKLYLTWLLAKEQQGRSGFFSPRADMPPPAGLKPLAAYNIVNDYRAFVTNEAAIVDLRKRYEAITGPVTNAGGVR
jgi:ABC-type Fe3+ transport system substrate-binding protein